MCVLGAPGRDLGALGLVLEAPGRENSQKPCTVVQIQGGQGEPRIPGELPGGAVPSGSGPIATKL